MLSRNGVSECELLKLIPMKWCDWLNLSDALHHCGIIVTRMGLMSLANKQVSCYHFRRGVVTSWLARSSLNRTVRVRVLADDITLCS